MSTRLLQEIDFKSIKIADIIELLNLFQSSSEINNMKQEFIKSLCRQVLMTDSYWSSLSNKNKMSLEMMQFVESPDPNCFFHTDFVPWLNSKTA